MERVSVLTLHDNLGSRDCGGTSRRDFLRIGALGLGGLTLPWWLQQKAGAAAGGGYNFIRDKSIILLFLCGGPSQFETFDPHMDAPAPARSLTGEIPTSIRGVTFGSTFEKMAKLAHRMAIVRSYAPHGIADHATAIKHVLRGGNPLGGEASMGSIATRILGDRHTKTGVPHYSTIIEKEIDSQYMEDEERMRAGSEPGALGATCAGFDPIGGGQLSADMKLNIPLQRLNDRRALLSELDRLNRTVDQSGAMAALDQHNQKAVEMILGGATREALDLSKEDPAVVQRYDTSHFRAGYLRTQKSTLGRRLLMARRLCEAGAKFVTVGMAGWDNHGNDKHPGVVEGMQLLGRPLDHVVSAFMEDVASRGLSDQILLCITGEFGRTVKIQAKGGRDHWPGLCPLIFIGGGLNMNQVIGESEKVANVPRTDPYKLDQLRTTLLHALFDIGELRLTQTVPRELVALATEGKAIRELF